MRRWLRCCFWWRGGGDRGGVSWPAGRYREVADDDERPGVALLSRRPTPTALQKTTPPTFTRDVRECCTALPPPSPSPPPPSLYADLADLCPPPTRSDTELDDVHHLAGEELTWRAASTSHQRRQPPSCADEGDTITVPELVEVLARRRRAAREVQSVRVHDVRALVWPPPPSAAAPRVIVDFALLAPNLTILSITCCTVPSFTSATVVLPPNLRVLDLSYNLLHTFDVTPLPARLHRLDLSFNNLQEVPRCLDELRARKPPVRIELHHNDYHKRLGPDTPPAELQRANDYGVLSTSTLRHWTRVARDRAKEARRRAREEGCCVEEEDEEPDDAWDPHTARPGRVRVSALRTAPPVHEDAQSAHLTSVQEDMRRVVTWVMVAADAAAQHAAGARPPIPAHVLPSVARLSRIRHLARRRLMLRGEPRVLFVRDCLATRAHSVYGVTFGELCLALERVVEARDDAAEVFRVMGEEYARATQVCLTGRFTHVLSALNGFVEGVTVGVSRRDELASALARVRNRWAERAGDDVDAYLAHAVPEALQVLEDACVPEDEQSGWLAGI